jgi:hypothetical protein
MKTILSTIFIIITILSLSCSGKDPVSASLNGDTKQKDGDAIPFILYQNSPNPFNPSTMIYFDVARSMHLTLKVYTEDWQEVATLFDGDATYPHYSMRYDARGTASGIYYYVMEGGGYKQIRAMRLMK